MIERIGHLNRKVSPPKGQPGRKANITSNSGIHGGSVSLEGNSRGHLQGTAVTLVVRLHYRQEANAGTHKANPSEVQPTIYSKDPMVLSSEDNLPTPTFEQATIIQRSSSN